MEPTRQATDSAFLVQVTVELLGGGRVSAFDVILASSSNEARNTAMNYYTQAGENIVCFGDTSFNPAAVGSFEVTVLAAISIHDPHNKKWKEFLDATQEWMRHMQEPSNPGEPA